MEAFEHGLINKVVKDEDFESQIENYIEKAKKLSGEVISLGKSVLNKQKNLELSDAYCVASKGMRDNIVEKDDCKQGLTAFAEKRSPNFKK